MSEPLTRDVTEVGREDFVKTKGTWVRIVSNTAYGASPLPRNWTIKLATGESIDMWGAEAYALSSDLPEIVDVIEVRRPDGWG